MGEKEFFLPLDEKWQALPLFWQCLPIYWQGLPLFKNADRILSESPAVFRDTADGFLSGTSLLFAPMRQNLVRFWEALRAHPAYLPYLCGSKKSGHTCPDGFPINEKRTIRQL